MDSISDIIYKTLKVSGRLWDKTRTFTKRYKFINNKKNSKYLILILAGYQEYVWDDVFSRINSFAPNEYDICIVSAGKRVKRLEEISKKNKWSYLYTKANKLAMALNTAIKIHNNAEYIFKLDEDIFVGKNFFTDLKNVYDYVNKEGRYKIGFVAPTININGASYYNFLITINKLDEYEKNFGKARITCDDDFVSKNGDAAVFLWENSLPIDDICSKFSAKKIEYFTSPIRYSIGAILFDRTFLKKSGYFISAGNGQLAWDELKLCEFCMNQSYSIIIAKNVFAGHFGFGVQKKFVIPFYNKNKEKFGIALK